MTYSADAKDVKVPVNNIQHNKKLKQFIGNMINSRLTIITPKIQFITPKKCFTASPMEY